MDFITAVIFAGIAFVLAVRTFFTMAIFNMNFQRGASGLPSKELVH